MENEIIMMVAKSGVFALLFVVLLFYVLRDSRNRERKYQQTIAKLSEELGIVQNVHKDVVEIKTCVLARPLYAVRDKV